MIVDTSSPTGEAWCPIDNVPVEREGQFCSPACWSHFHWVTMDEATPIEMIYLDIEEMSWYGDITQDDEEARDG